MTCSPRHENSLERLAAKLQQIGAKRRVNDQSHGKDGWKFPAVMTAKGLREYIADWFGDWRGITLCFEIDYQKKGSPTAHDKMDFRDDILEAFGIRTIRYTPSDIDGLDAEGLEADIRHFALGEKIVLRARNVSSLVTVAPGGERC